MLVDRRGARTPLPGPRRASHDELEARRLRLGGISVDVCTEGYVLRTVAERLGGEGKPLVVASANLDHVHHFGYGGRDEGLVGEAEKRADWLVLLDGMPLVWRARWLLPGADVPRLAGSDLLPALLSIAEKERRTVGFFGGMPAMHRSLHVCLRRSYPRLSIGGYWAPERADLEDCERSTALARQIESADVELLVVGLGKPRQEEWVSRYGEVAGARVSVLFGAAPDFLAGHASRAPQAFRESGFEWLYRLAMEPRRMAPRYLSQGPAALYQILGAR